MPLTDTAAKQAKFTDKQQKLSDEKGLYLLGKVRISRSFLPKLAR
ncbi:Arm DNA-binding domain-containing protein [Aeromonas veronii]|nr:Arm DNA-binding domain-containing protein [Aeromonas veronii]UUM69376.1 Arm DNA-binding domain-containing protein [Aeromonas veronii]